MYNNNIKSEYLEACKHKNVNLVRYLTVQFGKLEATENDLDKDCSCFTVAEIISYYKVVCTTSIEVLMVLNNQLKSYTDYCMSRNLVPDSQNHYREIDNSVLKTCVNTGLAEEKVITRERLLQEISNLNNPSDQFIILAIFEGICGKQYSEFNGLTLSSFNGNSVKLPSGRELTVSNELIHYAEDSVEEYKYYAYKNTESTKEYSYDTSDDSVIKRMYNAKPDPEGRAFAHNTFNKMVRIKQFLACHAINTKALQESGRIELIKSLKNPDETVDDVIRNNRQTIEYRYGKITSIPRWLTKYSDFI